MPGEIVRIGLIVEGDGEVDAVPILIRRICYEVFEFFAFETTPPFRIGRSKVGRKGELERAIQFVQKRTRGPILVIVDADDDCPAILGPDLKSRSLAIIPHQRLSVVIPKYEFETWFITAAESLSGKRGLREGLLPPAHPEAIRGAKEWLNRNMVPGRRYSQTIDQAALAAGMDLAAARACRSFDRLCREIERLIRPPGIADQN